MKKRGRAEQEKVPAIAKLMGASAPSSPTSPPHVLISLPPRYCSGLQGKALYPLPGITPTTPGATPPGNLPSSLLRSPQNAR